MNQLGIIQKMANSTTPYRIDFGPYLASLQVPASTSAGDSLQVSIPPFVQYPMYISSLIGSANIVSQSNDQRYFYFQLNGGQPGEVGQLMLNLVTANGNTEPFIIVYQIH